MKYDVNTITTVELELTTRCNASCPQCTRNDHGGTTNPTLPMIDYELTDIQRICSKDSLPSLEKVYLCGTHGDPILNRDILEICKWFVDQGIVVHIHTNGGIRNTVFWKELAFIMRRNERNLVIFGIDGLSDTNHMYRIGVKWDKLITNAQAYISNGGNAHWDYIVFQHNEHHVESARQFAEQLGFLKFNLKITSKFVNSTGSFFKKWPVKSKSSEIEYLELPSSSEYTNDQYAVYDNLPNTFGSPQQYVYNNATIECFHAKLNKIYIGADGLVFPCGWLSQHVYSQTPSDVTHSNLHSMITQLGMENVNAKQTTMQRIVNETWFPAISAAHEKNSLPRCAMTCGNVVNFVGAQNKRIGYWDE